MIEDNKDNSTVIKIKKSTLARLNKYRVHRRQSWDELVNIALDKIRSWQ